MIDTFMIYGRILQMNRLNYRQHSIIEYNGKLAFDKSNGMITQNELDNYFKLGNYYNIPQLYRYYLDAEGNTHIVIEYAEGAVTFESLFQSGMDSEDLLKLVRDTKATLNYIHSKGIVHSDLGEGKNYLYIPATKRMLIIDFENDTFDEDGIRADKYSCGLILFLIWHGDISQDLYDSMTDGDYNELVAYITAQKDAYSDDSLITTILEEILELYL